MSEERCSEEVWSQYFHPRCVNRAKVCRNGRWYCGIHDPVRLEEKRKKRNEKWDKERTEKQEKWQRERDQRQANWDWEKSVYNVCAGVSTEELEQLGAGWLRRHLDAEEEGK